MHERRIQAVVLAFYRERLWQRSGLSIGIVYLVVGGAATMAGPFLGTLVMVSIPEALQVLPILKISINGLVLLIFIIFLPAGIVGGGKLLVSKWRASRGAGK